MLPFYRDTQDIFLPVLIAADDLHNCYHIWYTPQYITLYVVCAIESDEMVEAKILWNTKVIAHVLLDLGLLRFFLEKGQQGLICGG